MPKSTVYGPVASWRLGRSLGIDMLCTEQKTCNFDCVYCQLGSTVNKQTERKEFVSLVKLGDDLNVVKGVEADWVTFSGMGEPTLASNLGEAITMAKSVLGLPVALLTTRMYAKNSPWLI
jgi:wyosine [tRNA(Phe)-imidazoG37] synthetase (radical SAM superfamily)